MQRQQKTQEKQAWSTPTIIVLTREEAAHEEIMRSCKQAWKVSSPNSFFLECEKVFSDCGNSCQESGTS